MPKLILILTFILNFGLFLEAQTLSKLQEPDTIRLKNGKEIQGIVVKQELGIISIITIDSISQKEKVKIYQQDEVKNVLKYNPSTKSITNNSADMKSSSSQPLVGTNSSHISIGSSPNTTIQEPEQGNVLQQIKRHDNIQVPLKSSEPVIINGQRSENPDDYFDPFSVPRPKRHERIWNRNIRGFRAFLDYAYIHSVGKDKNYRLEYGGSVGFQFNPIFYLGAGTLFDLTLNDTDSALPIFLNPRINFLDDGTTPFWDVKVGYSVAMGKGFYFSTSFGVSLTKNGGRALNLGIVYSLQNATFYEWNELEPKTKIEMKPTYHGIAFKLTYEFGIGR